jgi:hypothetical protein
VPSCVVGAISVAPEVAATRQQSAVRLHASESHVWAPPAAVDAEARSDNIGDALERLVDGSGERRDREQAIVRDRGSQFLCRRIQTKRVVERVLGDDDVNTGRELGAQIASHENQRSLVMAWQFRQAAQHLVDRTCLAIDNDGAREGKGDRREQLVDVTCDQHALARDSSSVLDLGLYGRAARQHHDAATHGPKLTRLRVRDSRIRCH